jgi:hypothetical protein
MVITRGPFDDVERALARDAVRYRKYLADLDTVAPDSHP